jgi:hypothetical protein
MEDADLVYTNFGAAEVFGCRHAGRTAEETEVHRRKKKFYTLGLPKEDQDQLRADYMKFLSERQGVLVQPSIPAELSGRIE